MRAPIRRSAGRAAAGRSAAASGGACWPSPRPACRHGSAQARPSCRSAPTHLQSIHVGAPPGRPPSGWMEYKVVGVAAQGRAADHGCACAAGREAHQWLARSAARAALPATSPPPRWAAQLLPPPHAPNCLAPPVRILSTCLMASLPSSERASSTEPSAEAPPETSSEVQARAPGRSRTSAAPASSSASAAGSRGGRGRERMWALGMAVGPACRLEGRQVVWRQRQGAAVMAAAAACSPPWLRVPTRLLACLPLACCGCQRGQAGLVGSCWRFLAWLAARPDMHDVQGEKAQQRIEPRHHRGSCSAGAAWNEAATPKRAGLHPSQLGAAPDCLPTLLGQ